MIIAELRAEFYLEIGDEIHETHSTACPVLKDCLAYMDCKVVGSCQAGDYTLFIGEILSCDAKREVEPLIYLAKDYFR